MCNETSSYGRFTNNLQLLFFIKMFGCGGTFLLPLWVNFPSSFFPSGKLRNIYFSALLGSEPEYGLLIRKISNFALLSVLRYCLNGCGNTGVVPAGMQVKSILCLRCVCATLCMCFFLSMSSCFWTASLVTLSRQALHCCISPYKHVANPHT